MSVKASVGRYFRGQDVKRRLSTTAVNRGTRGLGQCHVEGLNWGEGWWHGDRTIHAVL